LARADFALSGATVKIYNFASPRAGSPAFGGFAPKLDFEHGGTPASFTSFNGSITPNRQRDAYLAALSAAKAAGI
jgi:hypothetical protein